MCVSPRRTRSSTKSLCESLSDVITFCVNPGPVRGVAVKAMHTPAVALQAQNSSDFRQVLTASRASGDISLNQFFSTRVVAAWRGRRRVHGQGRAPEAALGVPLGEVWPNAGSSEAV